MLALPSARPGEQFETLQLARTSENVSIIRFCRFAIAPNSVPPNKERSEFAEMSTRQMHSMHQRFLLRCTTRPEY